MIYQIEGIIHKISAVKVGQNNFRSREFIIMTTDQSFEQYIKLYCKKNKCEMLDMVKEGDLVNIEFYIEGNRLKDKPDVYYTSLTCSSLRKVGKGIEVQQEVKETQEQPKEQNDDLPF